MKMDLAVAKKTKRKKNEAAKKSNLQLTLMCALPILIVIIFKYIPMFGIIIAFKDYKYSSGIFGSEWVGFKNFTMFLTSNEFARITWNTLSMNLLFIFLSIFTSFSLAVILYQVKKKSSIKMYQTMLITPHFVSWVIVSYMVYALLNPQYGMINKIMESFGREGVDWYAQPDAWPGILAITYVWKHVGMDCILYYAALIAIDSSLYEAADIDGATKWDKIKHIMAPSLVPLITILTILKIGSIFDADFGLFYQVTRNVGALYEKTDVIDTYIFRTMRVIGNMGISSAAGLLQSVVGLIMVLTTNGVVKLVDPERSLF